jgi:hypothetical protein
MYLTNFIARKVNTPQISFGLLQSEFDILAPFVIDEFSFLFLERSSNPSTTTKKD